MKTFISFFILSFALQSQAVLIGTLDRVALDESAQTDIFVVGYAGELNSSFLKTAMTFAKKTREQYPDRQIAFITENRAKDKTASTHFTAMGATVAAFDSRPLTATKLVSFLKRFEKIGTLHIVSHNALEAGAGLTNRSSDKRFSSKTPGIKRLKFTPSSYVVLHGCNTGFLQAPALSKIWGLPVFGSLTATNFQQVFSDNTWYFHDKILYPEDVTFLKSNDLSFASPVPCRQGGCHRLKPDYFPYSGFWGDFKSAGGLPFFKAFCNFSKPLSHKKQSCLRAMRQWVQIFPSLYSLPSNPTFEAYQATVKDLLCPIHRKYKVRDYCYSTLEAAELGLKDPNSSKIFAGNTLSCKDYGPCNVSFKCDNGSNHNCQLSAPKSNSAKTLINEYLDYLEAY